MKDLKPIDYKLLYELMKDSHRSDRQLAKALGVSQPTVTRRRAMLEENYIEGYTVIPKFDQMGIEIAAFTMIKSKVKNQVGQQREESIKKMKEWYMKKSSVLTVIECRSEGFDFGLISLHGSYHDYTNFLKEQEAELADFIIDSRTFCSDLINATVIKPFHLKYLTTPQK